MRKESKVAKSVELSNIQGYHAGGYGCGNREAYAFMGYKANKYFTSDRFILLDSHFNRPDGKPLRGFGLEIETECMGITNSTVYAEMLQNVVLNHFPADLFKLQHDGSLGGQVSAEIITQVMTREFIRNQYPNWKLMYQTYFPAFQISCSRSGNCGMHTNVSLGMFGRSKAAQDLAIRKILYFFNHHYSFACALVQRDSNHTGYCGRMMEYDNKEACKTANLENFPNNHGLCLNYSHYAAGRIEIRLVGGQATFGAFRNTMESIFHLVEAVKTASWDDMDDLAKLFRGCNQYVYDRLQSKCARYLTEEQLAAIHQSVVREELF